MADSKLSDQLYEHIKHDILFLKLEPGEAVSMQKLSDTYGGSRTPVREAVVRLEQEGLLIVHPQSKTEVSAISVGRVEQERFVRLALETAMVDDFVKNCSQLTVDTLEHIIAIQERCLDREDFAKFLECDNRFHGTFFEVARRKLAHELIMSNSSHDLRMRFLSISIGDQGASVVEEHRQLAMAAKERDDDLLRKMIRIHLGHWTRALASLRTICPTGYFVD